MMKGSGQGQLNYSEQLIEVVAAFGCTSVDRAVSDKLQEIDEDPPRPRFLREDCHQQPLQVERGGKNDDTFQTDLCFAMYTETLNFTVRMIFFTHLDS
jgi:hypothetical protein